MPRHVGPVLMAHCGKNPFDLSNDISRSLSRDGLDSSGEEADVLSPVDELCDVANRFTDRHPLVQPSTCSAAGCCRQRQAVNGGHVLGTDSNGNDIMETSQSRCQGRIDNAPVRASSVNGAAPKRTPPARTVTRKHSLGSSGVCESSGRAVHIRPHYESITTCRDLHDLLQQIRESLAAEADPDDADKHGGPTTTLTSILRSTDDDSDDAESDKPKERMRRKGVRSLPHGLSAEENRKQQRRRSCVRFADEVGLNLNTFAMIPPRRGRPERASSPVILLTVNNHDVSATKRNGYSNVNVTVSGGCINGMRVVSAEPEVAHLPQYLQPQYLIADCDAAKSANGSQTTKTSRSADVGGTRDASPEPEGAALPQYLLPQYLIAESAIAPVADAPHSSQSEPGVVEKDVGKIASSTTSPVVPPSDSGCVVEAASSSTAADVVTKDVPVPKDDEPPPLTKQHSDSESDEDDSSVDSDSDVEAEQLSSDLRLCFRQPCADIDKFRTRLDTQFVCLENVRVQNYDVRANAAPGCTAPARGRPGRRLGTVVAPTNLHVPPSPAVMKPNGVILVSIKVKNVDPEKRVFARCTDNQWATFADLPAQHVVGVDNLGPEYDRFCFALRRPATAADAQPIQTRRPSVDGDDGRTVVAAVEFAVCYQVVGQTYWDNNHGANYRVEWFDDDKTTTASGSTESEIPIFYLS